VKEPKNKNGNLGGGWGANCGHLNTKRRKHHFGKKQGGWGNRRDGGPKGPTEKRAKQKGCEKMSGRHSNWGGGGGGHQVQKKKQCSCIDEEKRKSTKKRKNNTKGFSKKTSEKNGKMTRKNSLGCEGCIGQNRVPQRKKVKKSTDD